MNLWKQKYESLAHLYAQLRKEHLDLLNKVKSIQDSSLKLNEANQKNMFLEEELKVHC